MKLNRLVVALFGGCLLLGGALGVEISNGAPAAETGPVPAGVTPRRPEPPPVPRTVPALPTEEETATTLARPLFSPTRRPPEKGAAPSAAVGDLENARLAGIVIEADRRFAVIAVPGSKAQILKEGDALQGWQVDKITQREVSLVGPSGNKTLQPKLDPALIAAAPAVAAPQPQPGMPQAVAGRPLPGHPMALPRPAQPAAGPLPGVGAPPPAAFRPAPGPPQPFPQRSR